MIESRMPDGQKHPADLEDNLGRLLRTEAADRRPEFSEALHSRIMGAVESSPPVRPSGWLATDRQRRWLAGTIAGALAVVLMLVAWQSGVFAPTGPEEEFAQETTLDPAEVLTGTDGAKVGLMVDQTLAQSQWAYLDHDAKIAANLLMDQLPFELASSEQP